MITESLSAEAQKNIARLVNRIRDNESCVFVGAGLSIPAGYPTWEGLLKLLKTEAERKSKKTINDDYVDPYDRAENYRTILDDAYRGILCDIFNPNNNKQPFLAAHRYLVAMDLLYCVLPERDFVPLQI